MDIDLDVYLYLYWTGGRTGERADGRRGALDANPPRTVEDEPATATLYKLPHTPRNGELQPTTALDTENLPSSWPPHRNSTSIEHLSKQKINRKSNEKYVSRRLFQGE